MSELDMNSHDTVLVQVNWKRVIILLKLKSTAKELPNLMLFYSLSFDMIVNI